MSGERVSFQLAHDAAAEAWRRGCRVEPRLNAGQLRTLGAVALMLARWSKLSDAIAVSQVAAETGNRERTVRRHLRVLDQRGVIVTARAGPLGLRISWPEAANMLATLEADTGQHGGHSSGTESDTGQHAGHSPPATETLKRPKPEPIPAKNDPYTGQHAVRLRTEGPKNHSNRNGDRAEKENCKNPDCHDGWIELPSGDLAHCPDPTHRRQARR